MSAGWRAAAILVLLAPWSPSSEASQLHNVTESVFSSVDLAVMPAAFGDFNSDKLTDLFVLHSRDRSKVSVLLAQPQTFSLAEEKYFSDLDDARKDGLSCSFDGFDVVGVAPSDFDGDGGMDVAVTLRPVGGGDDSKLEVHILWGDHDQEGNSHKLVCPTKAAAAGISVVVEMDSEPLVLDGNGDNIADLYGQANSTRGVWTFGGGRDAPPHLVTLDGDLKEGFRFPHSNSFVDMDADGNADLFVTSRGAFELWRNVGGDSATHFKKHKAIKYPKCDDSKDNPGRCTFQSAFADFDLDGRIDMVFPACAASAGDDPCADSDNLLYFATMKFLWESAPDGGDATEASGGFISVPLLNLGDWRFDPQARDEGDYGGAGDNAYFGLTPRVGDINLDGYPDLMLRMKNKATGKSQMHVFLNVYDPRSNTPHRRAFLLQDEIMDGIEDTAVAVFYDLYENGQEDVIVVQRRGRRSETTFEIGAFTNRTKDSDAYFVKVIVLSGVCYRDCSNGGGIEVPYGTNLPGQTVGYRTQRPSDNGFDEIRACAAQLPQTAHHALGLPYTIFGLGMAPNFLDFMYVNVTNSSSHDGGSKTWPQIIPNSQVYVIPHPPDAPSRWQAKLFITPSRGITLTGLALVGTCGLCAAIILVLHWRERQQDRREKLQHPNQFHFDAM